MNEIYELTDDKTIAVGYMVTDTMVFDIVKRTDKTIWLRVRGNTNKNIRVIKTDEGNPIVYIRTRSITTTERAIIRKTKDGVFKMWDKPMTFHSSDPGRRVDYRM